MLVDIIFPISGFTIGIGKSEKCPPTHTETKKKYIHNLNFSYCSVEQKGMYMPTQIIEIKENEPMVSTAMLSNGFKTEHRYIKRLIDKHIQRFERVGEMRIVKEIDEGVLRFENAKVGKKKNGRPEINYWLNEPQATFLITLLRAKQNGPIMDFKERLTKEFYRMRKVLLRLANQRSNADWLAKREAGIVERKMETDTIKRFVEYAKAQGSKSADKYYMVITKMQNSALFSLDFVEQKFPNIREIVDGFSLDTLKMTDYIVDRAIDEGMRKQLQYKEIYVLAKTRVENFAESIGKTPISTFIGGKSFSMSCLPKS
jgi:phage regulator Rha-like protein